MALNLPKVLTLAAAAGLTLGFLGAQPAQAQSDEDRRMLALNLYHEARSEGREGMAAVGWVTLNRVADPEFPNTITGVITQTRRGSCEFGWWCDGKSDEPTEAELWSEAQSVADELLNEPGTDPTDGALFFMESFRGTPGWMQKLRKSAEIGNHNFFARP